MKNVLTATMIIAALMAGTAPTVIRAAERPAAQAQTKSRTPAATITRKGVIKTIDETSVSMTPNENKQGTMTFLLTPAVKRSGSLAPGDPAAVTYYLEDNRPVVTEVTGKGKK
jgi:energy-converting hydrogenase Eha subunit F